MSNKNMATLFEIKPFDIQCPGPRDIYHYKKKVNYRVRSRRELTTAANTQ